MTSPSATNDVTAVAETVLEALEQAAFDLGVTLPTERYITPGKAVHDCEQVAIVGASLRTGLPSSGNIPTGLPGSAGGGQWCAPPWSAVMTVEIVRSCAPVPNSRGVIPKSQITAASAIVFQDADVLRGMANSLATKTWANFDITIQLPPMDGGMAVTIANLVVPLG